jgi:hypothetical protein
MSKRPPLAIPSKDELAEIASDVLKIPHVQISYFVETVRGISSTLIDFRERGISPNDATRRTKRALSAAHKNLQKSHEAVASEEHLLGQYLNVRITENLGATLSLTGMRQLLEEQFPFSLDERDLELAIKRSRDGGTGWITDEFQRVAQQIAADYPAQTLINLTGLLSRVLEQQLVLLEPPSRGQPKNQERLFALSRLSRCHKVLFDIKPTSAPNGKFCKMCEQVFASVGLGTDGLETTADGYAVDVQGDLAGMLAVASDTKAKTTNAGVAEAVLQVSLVAGVGFEPTTFRL